MKYYISSKFNSLKVKKENNASKISPWANRYDRKNMDWSYILDEDERFFKEHEEQKLKKECIEIIN